MFLSNKFLNNSHFSFHKSALCTFMLRGIFYDKSIFDTMLVCYIATKISPYCYFIRIDRSILVEI